MKISLPTGCEMVEVTSADYPEWLDQVFLGFGHEPPRDPQILDYLMSARRHDHAVTVTKNNACVATVGAFAFDMVMPGAQTIPVGAVASGTVVPAMRRQGLLAAMMVDLHNWCRETDLAAAVGVVAKWPLHARRGYGPAAWHESLAIDVPGAGWRTDLDNGATASYDLPRAKAPLFARRLFEAGARSTPGQVIPTPSYWERFDLAEDDSLLDALLGLADENAGVQRCAAAGEDGLVVYRESAGTGGQVLHVTDFLATTASSSATLWRHLLSLPDVKEIRVSRHPVDDPLRWWVVDARRLRPDRQDGLWLRPFDVPKLLNTRSWFGNGNLVLSVHDREGYAEGTFRLEVVAGRGSCSRSESHPDLEMDVSALGAIMLGGVSATSLTRSGRIAAHRMSSAQLWDSLAKSEREPFLAYGF